MSKDFNKWNLKKVNIHNYNSYPLYNQREIWWCLLGTNIGLEHDGDIKENTRPVLILKGLSKNICFVIPLTSSKKEHNMRVPIGNIEGKDAKAVIS